MIVWPHALPQSPLYQGAEVTFGENVTRFQPDVGREVRRRRTSSRDDVHSVSFIVDEAQLLVFREFYSVTIADGALSFQMMVHMPLEPALVSIRGPVKITPQGPGLFMISFEITRYG